MLALVFFAAFLVSFADFRGNMPSRWHSAILYLQFVPSVIKFLHPLLCFPGVYCGIVTYAAGRTGLLFYHMPTRCFAGFFIHIRLKWMPKKGLRFKQAHRVLRYSVLVLALISLLFTGVLVFNLLDPYALFGRMAANLYQPALGWTNNIIAKLIPASTLRCENKYLAPGFR